MTTLELDRLEEDVAKARERVVADVARLRSPAAMAEFKADIGHTFSDSAQRTLDDLKSRAAANPAAVLAIGAGLTWRFLRHPPIASVLVGVGLVSLFRTSPASPPSPVVTRTGEVLHAASETASELSQQAREFAAQARETAAAAAQSVSQTAARVGEQARQAAARVTERGAQLSDQAVDTATRVSGDASEMATRMRGQVAETAARMSEGAGQFAAQASRSADRMTAAAQQALADGTARDAFLLGFAALAVGAAAFINYRRGEA
jgi:hypothetical protein